MTRESDPGADSRAAIPDRSGRVYEALRAAGHGTVSKDVVLAAIGWAGLGADDPRLAEMVQRVGGTSGEIDPQSFANATADGFGLLERAVRGRLAIPDFPRFRQEIERIHASASADESGAVANYIPQLARVDPRRFASSVCSVDGQRIDLGDARETFCLQSCCKPILYCLALAEHGEEGVHRHVGWEPSGKSFNELTLNRDGLPHNPMINAGAIMNCALIRRDLPPAERFAQVIEKLQACAAGIRPGFDNATYLSERRTADRNFALGYFMREQGAFPPDTDLVETLEFYFQCCSITMDAHGLATVAATLANGGTCPFTGERVFDSSTVQKCLSLMSSCGMYDFSGEWAFAIGLPAKSGVSGCILVVVPNVLGLCLWSPRLDRNGNSVRGIRFARELLRTFAFHAFDVIRDGSHAKIDPRLPAGRTDADTPCHAASRGDVDALRRLAAGGVDIGAPDYDHRTALHLAAAEGHVDAVEFLLLSGADANAVDRFGNRPVDDARREGHARVVELLEQP